MKQTRQITSTENKIKGSKHVGNNLQQRKRIGQELDKWLQELNDDKIKIKQYIKLIPERKSNIQANEITDIYTHCAKPYDTTENNLSKISNACEQYANRLEKSADILDASYEIGTEILSLTNPTLESTWI